MKLNISPKFCLINYKDEVEVDGRMILKPVLEKQTATMLSGLNWLTTVFSGGLLSTR